MSGLTEIELKQQIDELLDIRDALSQKLRAAQHEAESLAATVEALKREFNDAKNTLQTIAGCTWDSGAEEIADIAMDESKRWVSRYDDNVLKKSPQQHLRDVRAEAGRAGFVECLNHLEMHNVFGDHCIKDLKAADQYAEKVSSAK